MILDIDAGNSRLKLRYGGDVQAHWNGESVWQALKTLEKPARVRVASVAGREFNDQLIAFCLREWGVMPEVAKVDPEAIGISCGYDDPAQLGVDRWLGVIAASIRASDAVVVSFGTATTVDVLRNGNTHLGGYIVPGILLMQDALYGKTSNVKVDSRVFTGTGLGKSTEMAVNNGIVAMLAAFIDSIMAVQPAGSKLICAGGGAELLAPHLGYQCEVVPQLVFEGLEAVFPAR